MPIMWRRVAFKGSAACGAAAFGLAYYQRVSRPSSEDYRPAIHQGTLTRLYQDWAAPLVFRIPPETAHELTLKVGWCLQNLRLLWEPSWTGATPLDWLLRPTRQNELELGPTLQQELFGGRLHFNSPVGLAAGFDKNALLVPLYRLGVLPGLGFAEVGSVSCEPASGNPQPRLFRVVEDEAVVNRMGLNNEGSVAVAARLQSFSVLGNGTTIDTTLRRSPVGVNIAKTHSPAVMGERAIADFVSSFRTLAPFADFMVLNVSCPNTEEGKTFEDPESLAQLLNAVKGAHDNLPSTPPPVLVKLSPPPDTQAGREDLRQLLDVVDAAGFISGLVISNTAGDRDIPLSDAGRATVDEVGKGGLSGKPLRGRSTAAIRAAYEMTGGRLPIIGCGGVDSAEAAYEKIRAGASLVELYSALVYGGPGILRDIEVGLKRLLERDGFGSVTAAVGAGLPE